VQHRCIFTRLRGRAGAAASARWDVRCVRNQPATWCLLPAWMVQKGYSTLFKVCATPHRITPHHTALPFTQKKMSALPNSAFFNGWSSLPPYMNEGMSTIAPVLVGHAHHNPGTTSSPQGSISSDTTANNTPQSASSNSTGLHCASIDPIGRHESAIPERQEYFPDHLMNEYNVFTASPQIVTAKNGRSDVDGFLPDLTLGHLGPLLPGDLFQEDYDPEVPPLQLDCFENGPNGSCHSNMLRPEPELHQYQACTSQAPAEAWEPLGELATFEQARNHYIDDLSKDRWYSNLPNDSLFQVTQHSTSGSSYIPAESQLTIGLEYNSIQKKDTTEKSPSNFSSTRDSVTTAVEDVQPQAERTSQPLLRRGLSRPIITKAKSPNSSRERLKDHKNVGESRLLARRQRSKCRGPFTDPVQRSETGETRRMGACIRCKVQRVRVRSSNLES
jgi:hypothetical protein